MKKAWHVLEIVALVLFVLPFCMAVAAFEDLRHVATRDKPRPG